jgi:predicted amidohydrolase
VAIPRWEVAARMTAIAAGAFVVTANRRGARLAGGSWIVAPDGDILARTNVSVPIVSLEIDLTLGRQRAADLSAQCQGLSGLRFRGCRAE